MQNGRNKYLVWRMGEPMECVLYLFIMRLFMGLSWCGSVLCANQLILLWVNLYVGGYMYYIGAIVSSHGGAYFF